MSLPPFVRRPLALVPHKPLSWRFSVRSGFLNLCAQVSLGTVCVLSMGLSTGVGANAAQVAKAAKVPAKASTATTIAVAAPVPVAPVPAAAPVAAVPAKATDLKADIEAKIASVQREAAPGLKIGAVSCPATLAGKKTKVPVGNYSCTIAIEGVPAPYTVVVKEGGSLKGGVFQISPSKAIIDLSKIVSFVKTSLDPADAAVAKISCGAAPVMVADPGAPIVCSLTRGKAVEKLEFEIRNVNGLVALKTGAKPAAPSTIAAVVAPSTIAAPKA
jgi:hypothetical protein